MVPGMEGACGSSWVAGHDMTWGPAGQMGEQVGEAGMPASWPGQAGARGAVSEARNVGRKQVRRAGDEFRVFKKLW